MQFLFAQCDISADNVLLVKPTLLIPVLLLVALLKNTRYDSLGAPPIGPKVKPLKFALENINDGVALVIDTFAADQLKKGEKGYDLLIQDVSRATCSGSVVHHVPVLITQFADLYIPREKRCVLEMEDTMSTYSLADYKTALKRLDAVLIYRIETGCNHGDLVKAFRGHIDEIRANIPASIPVSKHNTYIMLMTSMQMYGEFFSPLFDEDLRAYIIEWLGAQEQDQQPLNDRICSEFGMLLNQKIADGEFSLLLKAEVTPFDKGTHTIIVDQVERRLYLKTADTVAISKEMTTISDTDSLTTALYECGCLKHTPRGEKSIRIAAITSDGVPYPLYVQALNFTLLTPENRQRLDLIDKEQFLFRRDEIPTEGFLPLIKTVDGRYAGKMLVYENEENNIYFGTGRSGAGKSWAIAQILCMLLILQHIVVVFDVSRTYSKKMLYRMLPRDVVDKLFCYISVGVGRGHIPINLGSLKGCNNLPDKKRVIYSLLAAALGKMGPDKAIVSQKKKGLQHFLSDYLHGKNDTVDFVDMLTKMEKDGRIDTDIIDTLVDILGELDEIGCEAVSWGDLFEREKKIIIIDLGIEVGDDTHVLLDLLAASLFNWEMVHDSKFLTIAVDEMKDQNLAPNSPLRSIITDGRRFHTALIGATQDYFDQRHPHLDAMRQASIRSYCRPGKSEDKVAQMLGFKDAQDAVFPKFKPGDIIMELDAYSKDIGENEPVTLRGRVVDFVETPFYERFKREYQSDVPSSNADESEASQPEEADDQVEVTLPEGQELISLPLLSSTADVMDVESSMMEEQMPQLPETADDVPAEETTAKEALPEMPRVIFIPLTPPPPDEMNLKPSSVEEQLSQSPEPANSVLETVEAVPEADSSETTKPESVEVPTSDSAAAETAEAIPKIDEQPAPPVREVPEEDPQERIEQELQQQFLELKRRFHPDYPGWKDLLAELFTQIKKYHRCASPSDHDKLKTRLDCFLLISTESYDYLGEMNKLFQEVWPDACQQSRA